MSRKNTPPPKTEGVFCWTSLEKIGGQKLTLRIREFSNQTEAKATSDALIRRADIDNIIINPAQGYSLTLITAKEANSDEIVNEVQKQGFPIFSCARSSISIDDIYLKATGSTIADAELSALGARDLRKERKEAMRWKPLWYKLLQIHVFGLSQNLRI